MSKIPALPYDWVAVLVDPAEPPWLERLYAEAQGLYDAGGDEIYPAAADIFRAFELTRPEQLKVVVVGLDPYRLRDPVDRRLRVADGLAFSARGYKPPGSLQAMLYNLWESGEIDRPPADGDLTPWAADQGVLLLNLALTIQSGATQADRARHQTIYGELLRRVIGYASGRPQPVPFLLLGSEAKRVAKLVGAAAPGQVIAVRHPSWSWWPDAGDVPRPFTAINDFLGPARRIDWTL